MKWILLFLMFTVAAEAAPATFTKAPTERQLFPRDVKTGKAKVEVAGTVTEKGCQAIELRVFREGTLLNESRKPLKYAAEGAPFEFTGSIKAELANYGFEASLIKGTQKIPILEVNEVVAGDVLVINGQSNAEARKFKDSANGEKHPFLRSFGNRVHNATVAQDLNWREADGDLNVGPAAIGQWGLRMGKLLVEQHKVPVAIINGAHGGKAIGFFKRNEQDRKNLGSNYGRLLFRCDAAGVTQDVRAILWYQGESDKGAADKHEKGFVQLYQHWLEDYPGVERVYVEQLRVGCGVDKWKVDLRDRQRRLPEKHPGISVMSTTGIDKHDGCHYAFEEGYKIIGDRNAALLSRDLYGLKGAANIEAPNIARAVYSKPDKSELRLEMQHKTDKLVWQAGAEKDFRLEGSTVTVTAGEAQGNTLVLSLSGPAGDATGVTYSGHARGGPWVTNEGGVGMLTFWSVPIGK